MIHSLRQAKTPEERASFLDFIPVPRERDRADGWTPDRQRAFIEALADCGVVSRAARMVGMAPEGAYALRRHPEGGSFAEAWENAQNVGIQRLTDIAIERAIEGVPVPIFYKGVQIGERRWYNDKLLIFVLRHHDPDRYGGNANLSLTPRARRALFDKARAQIFAEQKIERDENEAGGMNRMFDNIYGLERAERFFRAQGDTERADEMAAMLSLVWLRIDFFKEWSEAMEERFTNDPLPTPGHDNEYYYRQARALHKLSTPSAYPDGEGGITPPDEVPPIPERYRDPSIRTSDA